MIWGEKKQEFTLQSIEGSAVSIGNQKGICNWNRAKFCDLKTKQGQSGRKIWSEQFTYISDSGLSPGIISDIHGQVNLLSYSSLRLPEKGSAEEKAQPNNK